MPLFLGIIAAPEAAGVYRHAIIAGFLLDAEISCAFPPSERIAAALLTWEAAGISCAVVDEGSYPEGVGEALAAYFELSACPLRVILSASRLRSSDDAELAALAAAGLSDVIGAWDERPAAHLKNFLTGTDMPKGNARLRRAERTQLDGTTNAQEAEAGAVPDAICDECIAEGAFDACIARLKHGGLCCEDWCPRLSVEEPSAPLPVDDVETIYSEPESSFEIVPASAALAVPAAAGREEEWEEIIALPAETDFGENSYIIRDLILYTVQVESAADTGGGAPARHRRGWHARYLAGRAVEIAGGVLLSLVLSLVASFIITMFLNPDMGALQVVELFGERLASLLDYAGLR